MTIKIETKQKNLYTMEWLLYNLADVHTSTVEKKPNRKKNPETNLGEDFIKEFRQCQ